MSKSIEVLLTESVDNLGIVGDVVRVKSGYARNYLLPHGYATTPSDELIAQLAERRAEAEAQLKAETDRLSALFEKLNGHELTIERATNDMGVLFGGVSQHDIAEALRADELDVEDRFIRIGEKINRVDTFYVPVQLNRDLKGEVVLHVKSDRELDFGETEVEEEVEADSENDALANMAADALKDA